MPRAPLSVPLQARHDLVGLEIVEFAVAGNAQKHQAPLGGLAGHGLDRVVLSDTEGRRQLSDSAQIGSVNLLDLARLSDCGGARDDRLGGLHVSSPTTVAVHELGLAVVCKRHELGRHLAADLAGVSLDGPVLKPKTLTDTTVGARLVLVVLLERLLRGVERVGVLHDELTPAEQPETRTHLIAELHVDLVERERQVTIAADLVAHQRGDDLLMRGPKTEVPARAVLETGEFGTVQVPTPRLVPEFGGLDDREHEFLGADRVHLLAHNLLDLLD